jgi:low temperature requirement protein LtrA
MSRALLVVQYFVVIIFVGLAHRRDVILPLFLNLLTYFVAAAAFFAMTFAFPDVKLADANNRIFVVWYIVMILEVAGTIAISSIWRMLSFKKTHIVERMELLTLIVIGEGAIGATKTIGKVLGKGAYTEGLGLVLCIILVLVSHLCP